MIDPHCGDQFKAKTKWNQNFPTVVAQLLTILPLPLPTTKSSSSFSQISYLRKEDRIEKDEERKEEKENQLTIMY